MSLGKQLRRRREELQMSREELAKRLGVSLSAIGNYETGISAPKEDVLLKMFDALEVDPNYLFSGYFRHAFACSEEERTLVEKYRELSLRGRQTAQSMVEMLTGLESDLQEGAAFERQARQIPLYRCPAAAGFAAPVFGEDFELIDVNGVVPSGAELAVRIQGDSMAPYIGDGDVVYVNHDPLQDGDVGIFCVDGEMLCKQYHKDPLGMVYLFSLNRRRADMDVVFREGSGRSLNCFGRVMMRGVPLPE